MDGVKDEIAAGEVVGFLDALLRLMAVEASQASTLVNWPS